MRMVPQAITLEVRGRCKVESDNLSHAQCVSTGLHAASDEVRVFRRMPLGVHSRLCPVPPFAATKSIL